MLIICFQMFFFDNNNIMRTREPPIAYICTHVNYYYIQTSAHTQCSISTIIITIDTPLFIGWGDTSYIQVRLVILNNGWQIGSLYTIYQCLWCIECSLHSSPPPPPPELWSRICDCDYCTRECVTFQPRFCEWFSFEIYNF